MNNLIKYVHQQAINYKTEKSIYNIITGKKSHQTFFDAVSLNLLTLFSCANHLRFEHYKDIVATAHTSDVKIPTSNVTTYHELQNTFITLQLLIQTLSNRKHHQSMFLPITSNITIHKTVKHLYHQIKSQNAFQDVENEIYLLFESLSEKQPLSVVHYFLSGYQESMYTFTQVGAIHQLDEDTLNVYYYIDLLNLYELIQNSQHFPYLSKCLVYPYVSQTVFNTYRYFRQELTLNDIASKLKVTTNTIEDHILDLYIKGYLSDYTLFLTPFHNEFIKYYQKYPYQKLKHYKSAFDTMSYFEIKLTIIGISKGVIYVS